MRQLQKVSLDVTCRTHGAYYFPQWPAVHKAYSDAVITAITGPRDGISKALAEGAVNVTKAAKE
jgi:hypothetical protein